MFIILSRFFKASNKNSGTLDRKSVCNNSIEITIKFTIINFQRFFLNWNVVYLLLLLPYMVFNLEFNDVFINLQHCHVKSLLLLLRCLFLPYYFIMSCSKTFIPFTFYHTSNKIYLVKSIF